MYMNLLCAGITILYTGMTGEVFWFLNIEKVGWLIMLFAFIFTAMLFGIAIGNAWGNLKNVSTIFSYFKFGFLSLVLSVAWVVTLVRLALIVFDEHPILCVITFLSSLGSLSKSMDYVPAPESPQPVTEPSSGTGSDGKWQETSDGKYTKIKEPSVDKDPYSPNGFPCCDNCKWNQDRGCYFVRCFQDSSRIKKPNDKCGQWERC